MARSAGPRDAGREAGDTPQAVRDRLRSLPSVEELAARLQELPHPVRVSAAREAIAHRRRTIADGSDRDPVDLEGLEASARERALAELRPRLRPVLNATGVIVHTNLGRAPLAERAIDAVDAVARGYSNLEYDLDAGRRGSRNAHVEGALRDVTGAAAATVVNNCAAAVLLAAAVLASGREVVVSRGQLIEIGGSFRIPDVVAQSGARLVEVGTTNRTSPRDYERAIGPDTGAVLRAHPSNFRALGFTEEVPIEDLCELAARSGVPVIDDAGSGALAAGVGELADEPAIQRSVRAGCALVCFSGDKLLGGPQAGLIVGTEEAVERCRRHPLARALRPDKMQLAALEATLAVYRDSAQPDAELPVLRMLTAGDAELPAARRGDGRGPARSRRRGEPRDRVVQGRWRCPAAARAGGADLRGGAGRDGARRAGAPATCAVTRRSWAAFATGACCSTRARSPTRRLARRPSRSRPCSGSGRGAAAHARHRRAHRPRQDRVDRRAHREGTPTASHEEHRRGISIELGYAPLELPSGRRISVVDVPGHERFVRTMVAGASGIDLFLLCVAADDGVMPQTREHLAVLRQLGLAEGVVAITKADLGEPQLAAEEVAAIAPAVEIVPVSTLLGTGLAELREALDRVAARLPGRSDGAAAADPRLHVDRSFTLRGIGTVVTGTLWSGRLARGDAVDGAAARAARAGSLGPDPRPGRRRGGGRPARRAQPGRRRLARGRTRRRRGASRLRTSVRRYRVDCRLGLEPAAAPLARGARVQVHHGTRETPARVVPARGRRARAGRPPLHAAATRGAAHAGARRPPGPPPDRAP